MSFKHYEGLRGKVLTCERMLTHPWEFELVEIKDAFGQDALQVLLQQAWRMSERIKATNLSMWRMGPSFIPRRANGTNESSDRHTSSK